MNYLTFMEDACVKAIEAIVAFEIHLVTTGHFVVKWIIAEIVAV